MPMIFSICACLALVVAYFACEFGAKTKTHFFRVLCFLAATLAFVASIGLVIGAMMLVEGKPSLEFMLSIVLYVAIAGIISYRLGRDS